MPLGSRKVGLLLAVSQGPSGVDIATLADGINAADTAAPDT